MAKKTGNRITPWGRLRIQAGVAKRHGRQKEARKLRAEADRLEKQGKKSGGLKGVSAKGTKQFGRGMRAALDHIEATSIQLGLTPKQTVEVFRSGISTTLSKGLDR